MYVITQYLHQLVSNAVIYSKIIAVQLLYMAIHFGSGKVLLLLREMHLPSWTNSRATFSPQIRELPVPKGFAGCIFKPSE